MNKKGLFLSMLLSAGSIALADNFIKNSIEEKLVYGEEKKILNGAVTIQKHHNKGFSLNALDKHQKEVAAVSGAMLVLATIGAGDRILKEGKPLHAMAHSLVIGGALSNTYDRIVRRYVVDYVSFKNGKVIYNISDFAIFAGAVLEVLAEIMDN